MSEFIDRERRDGDARCGTPSGAVRHSNRGERPCDACAAAKAEYDRSWRNADDNTKRNRLHAKAQARALAAVRDAHREEYRAAYIAHRDALFAEAGLEPRAKSRSNAP